MPGHDSKYEMSCRYAAKCGGRFLFRWHDNVIPTYEIERWASMDNGTPRMLAHFRSGRIQNSRRGSEVSRNCLLFDHPPLFSWKLFSYNYLDICRKWNYWNVIIVIKILGKYIIYFMFFWNMYIFVIVIIIKSICIWSIFVMLLWKFLYSKKYRLKITLH